MIIENKWLKTRALFTVSIGFLMNLVISAGVGAIATRTMLWHWLGEYGLLLGFVVGGFLGLSAWRKDPLMFTTRSGNECDEQWAAKVKELHQPVFLRSTLILDEGAAWEEADRENQALDLQRGTPVAQASRKAVRL